MRLKCEAVVTVSSRVDLNVAMGLAVQKYFKGAKGVF